MTKEKGTKMSDTDEVVWEEPPPKATGRYNPPGIWVERLQMLRDNPGRWVNATKTWGVKKSANISALKSASRHDWTDFTVAQRKNPADGTITVYVGYKVSRDGRGTNTERTDAAQ